LRFDEGLAKEGKTTILSILTITCKAIAGETSWTTAGVGAYSVCANRGKVTIVLIFFTFIDIWKT
jgi:hypothetical protein